MFCWNHKFEGVKIVMIFNELIIFKQYFTNAWIRASGTGIYVNFNPATQIMRLTPEPQIKSGRGRYVGVIGRRM